MADSLIDLKTYKSTLATLQDLMAQGQAKAMSELNKIRLETYWGMGRQMNQTYAQIPKPESELFVGRLATDLRLDKSLLYRMMQFQELWPSGAPAVDNTFLSWTHMVELLTIKDDEKRNFYLIAATKENWGRTTLRKAIQNQFFETTQTDAASTPTLARDPSPLYVYKAILENVIDGDTLLVRIDLGFEVWVNQRLRFRGVNASELAKKGVPPDEAEERAANAKAFVEQKLKPMPFIVIKTHKTDTYGRFIADIFYHPTLKQKEDVAISGFFLNDQLLQAGLVEAVF